MRRHVIYWSVIMAIQVCTVLYDRRLLPFVIVVTLMGVIGWLGTLRMIERGRKSADEVREKSCTDKQQGGKT
jgi:hypothetical protein